MSQPSSDRSPTQMDDLDVYLGRFDGSGDVERDRVAEKVVRALLEVRSKLVEAAQHQKISIREIARRLDVSPNNVARQLGDERDMKIGTAVMLAEALGRDWRFELIHDVLSTHPTRNFRVLSAPIATPDVTTTAAEVWSATHGNAAAPILTIQRTTVETV